MSKLSSKKRELFLAVLLSVAVLLTGLSRYQFFAAAYDSSVATAFQCSDSAINISDHDLSEWEDIPKNYFKNSSTDYFQLMWSANRLYFVVSANDAVKNSSGLWNDQVRIGLMLASRETGLSYFGADANSDDACWASVDQNELNRWWGEKRHDKLVQAPRHHRAVYL